MAAAPSVQPQPVPEDPSENFFKYFRFQQGRDSPAEARNALLVVATLIAAVTFQAGVNPPGGVWQDNGGGHEAGKSILGSSKKAISTFFYLFNTLALSASLSIITGLVLGCPFAMETILAIYAMFCTYQTSLAAVDPHRALKCLPIALLPWGLRLASQLIKKKRKQTIRLNVNPQASPIPSG